MFIKSVDCPILDNMDKGFNFFSNWLDVELYKGEVYLMLVWPGVNAKIKKMFIII